MNRKEKLVTSEYYHVYNRGVEKRRIFLGEKDYQRFLDTISHYLFTNEKFAYTLERDQDRVRRLSEKMRNSTEGGPTKWGRDRAKPPAVSNDSDEATSSDARGGFKRAVEIVAYCLMPNHFHLLLKQLLDKGITNYLHRLATSFTNYFNKKNERVGPLFQGAFKYKRIESGEQLIYVTKYFHRNPLEEGHQTKLTAAEYLINYRWSSLANYLSKDNGFLLKDPVLGTFFSTEKYRQFVLEDYDEKQAAALDILRLD